MANRTIRQSQFIYNYGPGSLVYLNSTSIFTLNLSHWELYLDNPNEFKFNSSNLSSVIQSILPLNANYTFQNIQLYKMLRIDENNEEIAIRLPSILFPFYLYCNKCNSIFKISDVEVNTNRFNQSNKIKILYCLKCKPKQRLIPSRWIKICWKGHISDFPYNDFAHNFNADSCKNPELKMYDFPNDSTGSKFIIKCNTCDSSNSITSLNEVMKFNEQLKSCDQNYLETINNGTMHTPFIFNNTKESDELECEAKVVIRGSGNTYFPRVLSILTLPEDHSKNNFLAALKEKTNPRILDFIKGMQDNNSEEHQILNFTINRLVEDFDISRDKILQHYKSYSKNQSKDETQIRDEEFFKLSAPEKFKDDSLFIGETILSKTIQEKMQSSFLNNYFSTITAIHKVKETKAFLSYTRVSARNIPTLIGKRRLIPYEIMISDGEYPRFPIIENFGEGIFFEINEKTLNQWSQTNLAKLRYSDILNTFEHNPTNDIFKGRIRSPLVMLHTLSHAILIEIARYAGYSAPSIKERIYFNIDDQDNYTAGIFIYIHENGNSGSLGGLVNLANIKDLEEILTNLKVSLSWCSHDPSCIYDQFPTDSQTVLSACHSCILISETSCEMFNNLLDRASLVGIITDEDSKKESFLNLGASDIEGIVLE